ncbi:MAG: site-specific integrase [Clostridiales bacterium]|nr:site-specific integrase [Clostridiales bacterium]
MRNTEKPLFFSMTYEYLEVHLRLQKSRSDRTIKSYRDALTVFRKYLLDQLGISMKSFRFADCTQDLVYGFLGFLKSRGDRPGTRNHRLSALKGYLRYASGKDVALQQISLSISGVPQCKNPDTPKHVLSDAELGAILAQPRKNSRKGLRDRTLMILLYDSAARIDEVLGAAKTDINFDKSNPCMRILGKGDKERVVGLGLRTLEHLSQYMSVFHPEGGSPSDFLFYTVIKGEAGKMSTGAAESLIQRHADAARPECPSMPIKIHPHMFRRTKATNMYQSGVELDLVSRLLGHAQIETTRKYAKPSMEMMREAMSKDQANQTCCETPAWCTEDEYALKSGLR